MATRTVTTENYSPHPQLNLREILERRAVASTVLVGVGFRFPH